MFEKLNEQLAVVMNQQHKRKKWKSQIADYEVERQEKQQNVVILKSQIEKNEAGIEKLEEISFTHLLAILTGSKDERIRNSENEIAAIKLKYDESQRAIILIEKTIKEIQMKLQGLPDIDMEYRSLLKEKEQLIEDAHLPVTRKYNKLSDHIAELKSFLMETSEAVRAGEEVESSLTEAINILKKAEKWGVLDMFGGSGFSTYVKHNHIDDAKESIHAAQTKMRIFQKELLDVHQESEVDIDIPGLLTFADFFFDGIFIDSIVQGKIEDALLEVEKQRNEIKKIMLHLNFRYDRKEKELHRLEEELRRLLEDFRA